MTTQHNNTKEKPFVGSAGKLLTKIIKGANIKTDKVITTEVIICDKIRYKTATKAWITASKVLRKPDRPGALRVYFCEVCQAYHLTKQTNSKTKRIRQSVKK